MREQASFNKAFSHMNHDNLNKRAESFFNYKKKVQDIKKFNDDAHQVKNPLQLKGNNITNNANGHKNDQSGFLLTQQTDQLEVRSDKTLDKVQLDRDTAFFQSRTKSNNADYHFNSD